MWPGRRQFRMSLAPQSPSVVSSTERRLEPEINRGVGNRTLDLIHVRIRKKICHTFFFLPSLSPSLPELLAPESDSPPKEVMNSTLPTSTLPGDLERLRDRDEEPEELRPPLLSRRPPRLEGRLAWVAKEEKN